MVSSAIPGGTGVQLAREFPFPSRCSSSGVIPAYAGIDVLAGEVNVWLLPEMNGASLSRVVAEMPEKWGSAVALVWDNGGVHKSAAKCLPDGVSATFLPAYSPELNPVERFFQELRRKIANKLFSSLEELENALVEAIQEYFDDTEKVKQLRAYPWILEQFHHTD